ncbi:MAG: DUF4402 domain-containing protein [Rhodospirillales bacterium]
MTKPRTFISRLRAAVLLAAAFILSAPLIDGLAAGIVPGWGQAQAQSINITERRTMLFGKVATSSIPGTVVISPSGNKSVTGGVIDLGKNHREAEFRITGPDNALVIVTLPTTATVTGGGGSGTLSNFTMNLTNPIDLGRRGRVDISVGATLSLLTNLPVAEYSGSFTVYVDPQ